MKTGRLEAFSDGVLAIVITIMVLELKAPEEHDLAGLLKVLPVFISYVLSFIYIAIYWNNHHHLMQVVTSVNGPILWANLHLLFWLSLVPFATSWVGEEVNYKESLPVATYGIVLLMAAIAYFILEKALIASKMVHPTLIEYADTDKKDVVSLILYVSAIPLSFYNTWFSLACFVTVAGIWLVPDRRLEKFLTK